ncbi:MAG: hypothetical protein DME69_09170 [Verrucomicrobia bacterium]|nr:MAG: hypothetical protein DME69_09170 [Verrucomicrobiota bacterium]PYL72949.1 MAG: hypothetical protein DMF26_15350 [Verrucomicrobiota bacterium]
MRALLIVGIALTLSSCSPAEYVHLFNATGEEIVITKDKSKEVVTIAPNASADFSPVYLPGERVLIRTSKHSWVYSPRTLFAPPSFVQQHVMVMRAFARIDSRGQIFLLAPPQDHGTPRETAQPAGFPVKPQKT